MTTYRRIAAVQTTIQILRFLADQKEPVPGAHVARALGIPNGTAMCHLVTLEDDRLVRRIGEHFELGDGLAVFWARRKAQLESGIDRIKRNLNDIGVKTDG
ncbi:MAG: helix-turn-helix domain-containing protein [Desulfobacteraceae bacterium]|nr:helix-turn-helix domain-containing protein [Desulfobacteraceae bacterium]